MVIGLARFGFIKLLLTLVLSYIRLSVGSLGSKRLSQLCKLASVKVF